MIAVKLEHSNLAEHQASIFKQLQTFRKEGQLCDVVVKSRDGTEHGAHTAVLCAASADLKNMLVGPFFEANQVQQGQPVEMAASDAVVLALLEYIYGDQPQVELEDSLELLRLADAYNFSVLAAAIEDGLCAVLESAPVTTALKVLQLPQDLHGLKAACEEKVAANFEMCIDLLDFQELSAGQLGRILRRDDLKVSREEVVVQGLFQWFNKSKDRGFHLGLLLQNVDFQSLSLSNLARLKHLSASMGPAGHDLQREIGDAVQVHKKYSALGMPDAFWPKRRCLQHWSPELGASSRVPLVFPPACMCWHDGAIYYYPCDSYLYPRSILRWKPGERESQAVAGTSDHRLFFDSPRMSVSPDGEIFVADLDLRKLVSFRNGSGNVMLAPVDVSSVSCSPSGAVYVLSQNGRAVEKLVGSTLQPVISSNNLPEELQFDATDLFATRDEGIYISDNANGRILRINPGEAEPVVVGEAPNKERSDLGSLFVTEDEKIYVADEGQRKVWAFHAGDAAWTGVLTCRRGLMPLDIVVQGRSLFVWMEKFFYHCLNDGSPADGVYEYLLPPELELQLG